MNKYFGPSTLVAAAFIGPGTLTTCTLAGVRSGYQLLWAMAFAVGATIVLQEMSARLGWATQAGLGEAIRRQYRRGLARYLFFALIIGAILVGNAAYEAGNLSGGLLGLELLAGHWRLGPLLLGGACFLLLWLGGYRWLERLLIALVLLMSACFLTTVLLLRPDPVALLQGFLPRTGEGAPLLLVLALIGTTVVPYNLFLHAATVSKKWGKDASLRDLRIENAVAIGLGGLISACIIITAAASREAVGEVRSAADLAVQLEPLLGTAARWIMGIGLLAAGISSALTAPIAAAYAARGLFGWPADDRDRRFRAVWMGVLAAGVLVASTGWDPVLVIQFAQVANALLLPVVATYLLYASNARALLGEHTNGWLANALGAGVVGVTVLLALKSLGFF